MKNEWDYTKQAKFYAQRPNYSPRAISKLLEYVEAKKDPSYIVCDIGAGTGNLTVLLADNVGKIIALEPNEAMRSIGMERTKSYDNVLWTKGTGEKTELGDHTLNLITYGSSFNTVERDKALIEAHRVLKPNGYFVCMWNNRDLTIPSQIKVEEIIKKQYPTYSHGVRREQQADVILGSGFFNHLFYFEQSENVTMPLEHYLNAWRSVKNNFWNLNTKEGKDKLETILKEIRTEFTGETTLDLRYITRIWVAKRQEEQFSGE